jgi:hypothetical protein
MQTRTTALCNGLAAMLALVATGNAAPATTPGASSPPPVEIVNPKAGSTVRTLSVQIETQIQPTAIRSTFAASINGKDITALFAPKGACRGVVCTESAIVTTLDGLVKGQNVIRVRIKGWSGGLQKARLKFAWDPTGSPGGSVGEVDPQTLLTNYNFTTVTPGGYQSTGIPWFQISSTGLRGTTRSYPAQPPLCGGRGFTYTLIQIDRATLNEVATSCLNTPQVDAALQAVPSTQFAVFGTNSTYNADWQNLNTAPIGGTDFRGRPVSPEVPYGYMVIGIGQAPSGVATESYNTGYEVNELSLAQMYGIMTRNGHGLFDYHPSNWVTYSIDGPNKKVTLDGQTITPPPTSAATGFWVLPMTRNNLTPLAGAQGVVFDASNPADLGAMNALLSSLTWRQLAFVVAWGKQPGVALSTNLNPAVTTLASMGVPYPTLQGMTDDNSTFAALLTPDPSIAIALPNRRVPLSVTPSGNGQKGQLVGSLGRDKYYLLRPTFTAQADLSSSTPIDASFLKTIWLPNSEWPLMDTPGHVAAYKCLSSRLLHFVWQNNLPAGPTDDIRYYYTVTGENVLLHGAKPDIDPVYTTYPDGGTYTNPDNHEVYTFSQQDLIDAGKQLRLEIDALADVIPFLGNSTTGANLRGRMVTDANAWMTAWVDKNKTTLSQMPYVNPDGQIGFSFDDIVYHATALAPNPVAAGNPLFAPLEGMVASLTIAVGSTGALDVNNNGVPTASYAVNTTIQDLTSNYSAWTENADAAYDQIVVLALSDWNRLQTLSQAIRTKWFVDDYSVLDHSPTLQLGANRFFYENFLRTYYSLDSYFFVDDIMYTSLIGSQRKACSGSDGCQSVCTRVYSDPPQNTSGVFFSFPPDPKYPYVYDLFQMAGPIKNQNDKAMSVDTPGSDVGLLLFGTDQMSGQFALPKDVWFTMGALPERVGASTPQYGYGACVLYAQP